METIIDGYVYVPKDWDGGSRQFARVNGHWLMRDTTSKWELVRNWHYVQNPAWSHMLDSGRDHFGDLALVELRIVDARETYP